MIMKPENLEKGFGAESNPEPKAKGPEILTISEPKPIEIEINETHYRAPSLQRLERNLMILEEQIEKLTENKNQAEEAEIKSLQERLNKLEEELRKWKEAIRRHNEEVRDRAERINKARKEQAEEQREVPIFCYKLPKRGETEEEKQEREKHNQEEFQRFLGYYRGLSPQELENRGWTGSTEGEGFLKFVKDKWNEMWKRAVGDVENKFSKITQTKPPQETNERKKIEPQESVETGKKEPQESAPAQKVENPPQEQGENPPQEQGENLPQEPRNEWVEFGRIKIKKELISKSITAGMTVAIGEIVVLILLMFGIPSSLVLLGGVVAFSGILGWCYNEKIQNFLQKIASVFGIEGE